MKRVDTAYKSRFFAVAGITLMLLTVLGGVTQSRAEIVYGATADIRVWLAEDYDIYPAFDDMVFYVRAARDCHALVYIVDTDGFLHVIHPFSPYDDAWIEGGVTYRITARDAGLYGFDFNRGIAFVYAIGSPYPFDYSYYGNYIFAGRFAYRIYGDPFIACKRFYISLLPVWCNRAVIGVSYSHFYIREWARYPRYLCMHHGMTHWGHDRYCRDCSQVYETYRHHLRDPYRVLSPNVRYKGDASKFTRIASVPEEHRKAIRAKRNYDNKAAYQSIESRRKIRPESQSHKKTLSKQRANREGGEREVKNIRKTRDRTVDAKKSLAEARHVTKNKRDQRSTKSLQPVQKTSRTDRRASSKYTVKEKKVNKVSKGKTVVRSSKEIVKKEKSRTVAFKRQANVKRPPAKAREATKTKSGSTNTKKRSTR